jgi:hypothetical protein
MHKKSVSLSLCLVGFALLTPRASVAASEETGWVKVGAMVAAATVDQNEDFEQYEIFLTYALPWHKNGETWSFFSHLDMTGGMIADSEKYTSIGSIGPRVGYRKNDGAVIFDIGSRVTLVGDDKLGERALDGPVHFTSHFRIGFGLFDKAELGFRIQHMSNAGLGDHNPGLDLLVVDLAWYF